MISYFIYTHRLECEENPPILEQKNITQFIMNEQSMTRHLGIELPEMSIAALINGNTRKWVESVLTITPEEELAALQKKYDALQKQYDKDKHFIESAMHDIKTPLTCINGFIGIALSAIKKWDYHRIEHCMNRIQNSGSLLNQIAENMLITEKYRKNGVKLNLSNGNIELTVSNLLDQIDFLIREKDITVTVNNNMNTSFSYDEQKMTRVIMNLVGNAVKFCEIGDCIEISLSNTEWSIFIKVSDTGPWIPSDEIDSLFHDYTQIQRSRKSEQWVGLGLSICRSIIEAHGGNIWASNNDLKGASFEIRLPRTSVTTH